MRNKTTKTILVAGLAIFASSVYAGPPASMVAQPIEQAPDPKKKKAGEECKSTADCQRHHACLKTGEKNICVAEPQPVMPPT